MMGSGVKTRRTAHLLCGLFLLPCLLWAATYTGELQSRTIASGLQQPDGIAFHPSTGEMYISEKGAGRISKIEGGRAVPVIDGGWQVIDDIPRWAFTEERPRTMWMNTSLQSPGNIAIATNGHLFVCEEVPDGRLLEFIPNEQGRYTQARAIPISWLSQKFTWEDVKVTEDGRLFICGSVKGARRLSFGSVLMRDVGEENWWVVDYGPFMDFVSLYLSRNEDILAVCDRSAGALVWWDTYRHLPIGEAEETIEDGEAVSLCLASDGAFVVAEQQQPSGGKLVRIDPLSGEKKVLAEGFKRIGTINRRAEERTLYVTDEEDGVLVECKETGELLYTDYLLQRSLDGYEMEEGYTPRAAPSFLKNFFSKVGVRTEVESRKKEEDLVTDRMEMSYTLRELSEDIPMIAGKLNATETPETVSEDPITDIEFLILFPGRVVGSGDVATPSFSFFTSKRKSGELVETKELFTNLVSSQRSGGRWVERSEAARIFIPIATVSMERQAYGMNVNIVFLGLGIYDDYYLNLTTGKDNKGEIIVQKKAGGGEVIKAGKTGKEIYEAIFTEITEAGKEKKNLVVAGFDPLERASLGWLDIGNGPVSAHITTETKNVLVFSGLDEEVSDMINRKNWEWEATRARVIETNAPGDSSTEPKGE